VSAASRPRFRPKRSSVQLRILSASLRSTHHCSNSSLLVLPPRTDLRLQHWLRE
jgi:hypothetical protein